MFATLLVMAVALVVLFGLFSLVEWRWPAVPGQRRRRRGFGTDIAWFFFDGTLAKPITTIADIIGAIGVALVLGVRPDAEGLRSLTSRDTWVTSQPAWLQAAALLVLFDVTGYWSHRFFHRRAFLWKFHAVHHSSEELDWLSSVRVHPVNEAGQRLAQAVPMLLLGFRPELVAAYVPLFTLYAIGLHANVSWGFGPLKYVIASPLFHRWHHTSEQEGLDRNFAGLFPWIDLAFGTLYLPKNRQPQQFGVLGEPVPEGIHRQLVYPFRRSKASPQTEATERA